MRFHAAVLGSLLVLPHPAPAQAPAWTDLWRVADGTLVRPAALGVEPTAAFWNPAAVVASRGPAFAAEVLQTPDVVNVSGVLLGATHMLGGRLGIGLIAGRLAVGNLVRTTTSPASEGGDIPVFSQFLGGGMGARVGPLIVAGSLLLHDARLDGRDAGGATLDAGIRLEPFGGLALGMATHLGDPALTHSDASEVLAAVAYTLAVPPAFGLRTDVQVRYGFTMRSQASGGNDHLASAGILLGRRLAIDGGVIWSEGYGSGAWQPLLGLAFRAGVYHVGIARGSGIAGVGASYRVTLGAGGAW